MSLPPAEVLSRWTVGDVNKWLSQSSLTVFRDEFLRDQIDGSKLMRMQAHDVDSRYNVVPARKRQILKDCLSKIESPKSVPSWNNAAPQLPPRGPRAPAALPPQQDDHDDSEDGWGSDFVDDIGSDDDVGSGDDYLEPTVTPAHVKQKPVSAGRNLNGHNRQPPPVPRPEEPQSQYEIPAEETPVSSKLSRRTSLVDQLKSELQIRKRDSQVQQDAPPPRPPRVNKPDDPSYCNTPADPPAPPVTRHRPPPPQPQPPPPAAEERLPPDDVYEIVASDSNEPEKKAETLPQTRRTSRDLPLPPRPVKQGPTEKQQLPPPSQAPVKQPPPQPPRSQGGWLFSNNQATPTPAAAGDDLSTYDWYHGRITRDHAQNIFSREQKDGMFLIRKSERDPDQPYTLVIWHCNRIWNLPIRKVANNKFAAGKFKEGEQHFDSLPELIEHFKVVSLSLKSNDQIQATHNLTVPAPRR